MAKRKAKTRFVFLNYDFFNVFSAIIKFSGFLKTVNNQIFKSSHFQFPRNISKCHTIIDFLFVFGSLDISYPEK